MADPVLELDDVKVHFGGVKAVDGVSFQLEPGLIYGLLGPNGSGKSTLLAAITRLVPLTSGRLAIRGVDYGRNKAASLAGLGVARTFQTVRLLPDLTARENVRLGADVNRNRKEALEAADEALERAGATELAKTFPTELSYGDQRRVEIARALAMRPSLLLIDEPTAGMNKKERQAVAELLQKLRTEGVTELLVEHDVQMMVDTCDYLFAMNAGRVIAEGQPVDVVRNPAVQEAYLGKRWKEHDA